MNAGEKRPRSISDRARRLGLRAVRGPEGWSVWKRRDWLLCARLRDDEVEDVLEQYAETGPLVLGLLDDLVDMLEVREMAAEDAARQVAEVKARLAELERRIGQPSDSAPTH